MSTPSNTVPERKALSPSTLDFPVVGIGASAGGLQAIKRFFENMPQDNGMAFVIILHLSPDHQSFADKIIQESTRMTVLQVGSTVPIEKNRVYVISPAQQLNMNDGLLEVSPVDPRLGRHSSIDLFFRDLADVHRERAFCLVLSGTGSDGAVGLSRIKEQGGITMAQVQEDAEFDGMPQAAIDTHMVDFVLPVVEMPQKLLELWSNAREIKLPTVSDQGMQNIASASERDTAAAEQVLHDILIQLRTGTGHDFKHYKRATVLRRIERRMQVTAQPDLVAYYKFLQNNPEETKALLGDMLIGVTNFFRDREAFEALERDVVPQLVSAATASAQSEKKKKYASGPLAVPPAKKPTAWRCCCTIRCNWTPATPRCKCLPPTSTNARSATGAPACIRKRSSPTCRRHGCATISSRKTTITECARSCAKRSCSPSTACCPIRRFRRST